MSDLTPEERARLHLHEACPNHLDYHDGQYQYECFACTRDMLRAAVAQEKEACAALVENFWKDRMDFGYEEEAGRRFALRIRKRTG